MEHVTASLAEANHQRPNGTATLYQRRRRTWSEVAARVSRLAPTEVGLILEDSETGTLIVDEMSHPLLATTLSSAVNPRVVYGGEGEPPAVMAQAIEVFPQVSFMQGYGMSELSPVATFLEPQYHVLEGPFSGKLKSAGRAVGTAEVRVVDGEDRPVPPGTVGEVVVRGPIVMQGYWKQPELTAQAIRGGWMHTGDAGYLDEEGFLFIVDRMKDMIISGGENIYSVEVESAIYGHPAVGMCAVFGVPNDQWGEAVHAVVVLKPETAVTEPELIEFSRTHLAHYKCPRSITFRDEPMPISGAGKILKTKLRAPYWQGRTRAVN